VVKKKSSELPKYIYSGVIRVINVDLGTVAG